MVRTNLKTDLAFTSKINEQGFEDVKSWRDFEFAKVESKCNLYLGEGVILGGDAGNVQQLQSKFRKRMHMRLLYVQMKERFGVWVTRSRVYHDECLDRGTLNTLSESQRVQTTVSKRSGLENVQHNYLQLQL